MASRPETTPEYREALHDLGRGAAAASAVGFFVNLLHLALPLYTIQIYDRVISSGSIDTLVALTLIVAILLGFQAVLDFLRQRIFTILGARVAGRLGQPVFEAAVETAAAARAARLDRGNARPRRPAQLRRRRRDRAADGFGGHALLSLRAVPAQPGLWRHRPRRHAAAHRRRAGHRVLRAPPERARERGRLQRARRHRRGDPQRRGHRRYGDAAGGRAALAAAASPGAREHRARPGASPALLAAAAKTLRIGLQIAVVGAGAVLVIEGMASGGTIVAAAVLSARLLLPFEQLIDGWRQWLDAFAALDRLRDVLSRGAQTRSRQPVAVEHATLAVDRLGFVPPGQDRPLLRNVSFRVEAGELVGVIGPSGRGQVDAGARSSSGSGNRRPAASISTARAPTPTSAAASARPSATCRRSRCSSRARCARTSPASAMPTWPTSSPRRASPACMS